MIFSFDALVGQIVAGLINGAFYAILSLGLALIFGMLNVVNFAHGAFYMAGAFIAWGLLHYLGLGYWPSLILAPLLMFIIGVLVERILIRRTYGPDHTQGLLLTLGLAFVIEGAALQKFGTQGLSYSIPAMLKGGIDLGAVFIPIYRVWIVIASLVVCTITWFLLEKTSLGARLRATSENSTLVETFGIDVQKLRMLTYGGGAALAALGGVMAAPTSQVNALMSSNIIVTVFAVVVIGGMGSIAGSIVTGFALGLIEGLTKFVFPQASTTVIFVIMAIVLLIKPAGLFGTEAYAPATETSEETTGSGDKRRMTYVLGAILLIAALAGPFVVYPLFLIKIMIFALFATAFGFLAARAGILSFGHAAFFGVSCYVTAYGAASLGLPLELTLVLGTASAALLGLIFGALAIRRQGIYFAMITLALAQMVYFFAVQAPFTGGEDGITSIPRGRLFGLLDLENPYAMYYVVFVVVAVAIGLLHRVMTSPFGQVLAAISQNESRMASLGYKTQKYKLIAFTLSAALSGLAGSLKAVSIQLVSLSDINWGMSTEVLLMTLLGGMGSFLGPTIGAIILSLLEFNLADVGGALILIVKGVMFVLCVLFLRGGVVGVFERLLSWLLRKARQPPRVFPG